MQFIRNYSGSESPYHHSVNIETKNGKYSIQFFLHSVILYYKADLNDYVSAKNEKKKASYYSIKSTTPDHVIKVKLARFKNSAVSLTLYNRVVTLGKWYKAVFVMCPIITSVRLRLIYSFTLHQQQFEGTWVSTFNFK